jgi:hypothetical protein
MQPPGGAPPPPPTFNVVDTNGSVVGHRLAFIPATRLAKSVGGRVVS